MPEISIIIPVYNSEKYIERCINSILAQTFSDYEIIIINDGSNDQSGEICENYALKNERIKVLHQKNQGQAAARNKALNIANGEYIAFVDSDDYVHPQMLETLYTNIKALNGDISICGSEMVYTGEKAFDKVGDVQKLVWKGKTFLTHCLLNNVDRKSWVLWDKLYHKSCFEKIRLPEGRIFEDNAVVYRILYNANKVIDCDEVLYYYYQNNNSTVNMKFNRKHLQWLLVLKEMKDFFVLNNEKKLSDEISKRYLWELFYSYNKVLDQLNDEKIAIEIRNELKKIYKEEKKKYPICIREYPALFNVIYPVYANVYWTIVAVINKIRRK